MTIVVSSAPLTSSLTRQRAFATALPINFSAIKVITFYHYVSVQLPDGNARGPRFGFLSLGLPIPISVFNLFLKG